MGVGLDLTNRRSEWTTWTAGVFSLRFVLTAAAGLVTQILEVHLHLLISLLDRCLCCMDSGTSEPDCGFMDFLNQIVADKPTEQISEVLQLLSLSLDRGLRHHQSLLQLSDLLAAQSQERPHLIDATRWFCLLQQQTGSEAKKKKDFTETFNYLNVLRWTTELHLPPQQRKNSWIWCRTTWRGLKLPSGFGGMSGPGSTASCSASSPTRCSDWDKGDLAFQTPLATPPLHHLPHHPPPFLDSNDSLCFHSGPPLQVDSALPSKPDFPSEACEGQSYSRSTHTCTTLPKWNPQLLEQSRGTGRHTKPGPFLHLISAKELNPSFTSWDWISSSSASSVSLDSSRCFISACRRDEPLTSSSVTPPALWAFKTKKLSFVFLTLLI